MPLILEPRAFASPAMARLSPVLAVGLSIAAGFVLFAALGYPPLITLHTWFIRPLSSIRGIAELVLKATPICLCGLGLALGFRANVWNIGAEGQLVVGALAGGALALAFYPASAPVGIPAPEADGQPWLLPLMLVAGAAGGMVWAAVPAWLRVRCSANEILTSLMLTYIAGLFLSWAVHGPLRDPEGFAFPESRLFQADAHVPLLIAGTRLHWGVLAAPLAAAALWLVLCRGFLGFQVTVQGLAPAAAVYAGFSQGRSVWITLLVSGGLAGLAGVLEVAGPIGQLTPAVSPGYGFTGIIAAFLGRLHPLGVMLASLLLAQSYLGGESVQIALAIPPAATGVFQGLVLFFLLGCDVLIRYRLRYRPRTPGSAGPGPSTVLAGGDWRGAEPPSNDARDAPDRKG